ncbi:hypothetical protein niasHT_001098 [Heterodera trifolii]|uniref:FLYWCH-type domain-containing protein n=1 Tax=Heterodera trifolii TaxID=157864 RepID=A0ABD2LW78_9BILA
MRSRKSLVQFFTSFLPRQLEHDGALYVFDQFSADGLKKFWRCEFHGPADKCKGRLHTDLHNVVQKVYNTDPIFAEKSKMITSLAFLPVHHLQAGLNAIQAQLPAQLHGIFNWFLDNYTGKPWFNGAMTVPLFDPHEWSVHQRTLDGADRTNNFAEAFHRKLQRQFNCTHPTIGDSLTRSDVCRRRLMLKYHIV